MCSADPAPLQGLYKWACDRDCGCPSCHRLNYASVELLLVREVREGTSPKAPLAHGPLGMEKGQLGHLYLGLAKGTLWQEVKRAGGE